MTHHTHHTHIGAWAMTADERFDGWAALSAGCGGVLQKSVACLRRVVRALSQLRVHRWIALLVIDERAGHM